MAQIFYVTCPSCAGKFPCHPELWQVDYKLLCPFCQHTFRQEESPLIITATGERRPGRDARSIGASGQPASSSGATRRPADDEDPTANAESM